MTEITIQMKRRAVKVRVDGRTIVADTGERWSIGAIGRHWRIVEHDVLAKEFLADEIREFHAPAVAEKKARLLARRRQLAHRTPEEKVRARANREAARQEKIRKAEDERLRLLAIQEIRSRHLSTEEVLLMNGWTRHYVKRFLKPDHVEEFTVGSGAYRKDVTRHLYLPQQVEAAMPMLLTALERRRKSAA